MVVSGQISKRAGREILSLTVSVPVNLRRPTLRSSAEAIADRFHSTAAAKDVVDLPADGSDVIHVPAQHGRLAERRRDASQDVIAKSVIRTVPPEYSAVPLAAPFAADLTVEPDVGRKVSAVGFRAIAPRVDVFEHPSLVPGLRASADTPASQASLPGDSADDRREYSTTC